LEENSLKENRLFDWFCYFYSLLGTQKDIWRRRRKEWYTCTQERQKN